MADQWRNCCFCRCSTFLFVHILLIFITASLAKDITDDLILPDPYNSSLPLAYQNSTTPALGNRRRTSRWRTTDPGPTTTTVTTLHDGQLLSNAAEVRVNPFRGSGAVSLATIRSPQSGDVAQESWTVRPRHVGTMEGSRWTSEAFPVGSDIPKEMDKQWKASEVAMMTTGKDGVGSLPDSLWHDATVASDLKYARTDKQGDGTDYVGDYNDHEDNNDEDDDDDDDDDDDEDYDDYDDDEDDDDKSEFYNYDEDYDENDNRRHPDSDSYEGDGDSDGVGDGNMRRPFNYTDMSDPGSREMRRLVINGKSSSHIDMSLLVIYAWLGLVVIMVAITVLIFKYKQQLSTRCLKVTSSCRKVRQVIGIEEGNNLLAHPLV